MDDSSWSTQIAHACCFKCLILTWHYFLEQVKHNSTVMYLSKYNWTFTRGAEYAIDQSVVGVNPY